MIYFYQFMVSLKRLGLGVRQVWVNFTNDNHPVYHIDWR